MHIRRVRQWPLTAAVASVIAAVGLAADGAYAGPVRITGDEVAIGPPTQSGLQIGPARYIVRFAEPPVAEYNASIARDPANAVHGLGAIPLKTMKNGRQRLDVRSAEAGAYANFLQQRQGAHLAAIAAALGHAVTPLREPMRHALNAVVLRLTPAEARQLSSVDGVAAVYRDAPHAPTTDIGPGFIGAASLWWGTPTTQDTIFANGFELFSGFRGDGLVAGIIDTGYNSLSPSFSATDDSGYTIQNPLGSGNFLGQCNVPGISLGGCNAKVIGVYDMVDANPPFSVEDTQGHGSHTASTVAGNSHIASLDGYTARISGVAPHANLVIFYACSPDPNVQCQDSFTSGAVDLAIQDGAVDALNYSISGGTSPWNDPTSLAFLSAADAGIFVAASAGNTNASVPAQVPGTTNHVEPWVITVAASTHTGGPIGSLLSLTGPGTPPANTQDIGLSEATADTPLTAPLPATTPIVLSPQFQNQTTTGTDGCSGYPAGLFTGAIALVSRGSCNFTVKVNNAVSSGAIAVVISDNRVEGRFIPDLSGSPATVPVWSVLQGDGTHLATFLAANSDTGTASVSYPPSRLPQQPDVLANFSLLGPAGIDVIKPDVQAPGVNILAAIDNDGSADGPSLVGLMSGTSMAAPHTTGSGVLLLGIHPGWSPLEVKSALMTTALEVGLTKANGSTPSDFFDRGSGRLQDFIANQAGLVLDETGLNFALADPANGGDPGTLNLASMQNLACVNACRFQRRLTSTQPQSVTWTATVNGDALIGVTVSPSSFAVGAAPARRDIQVDIDSSVLPADGSAHFTEIVLTPSDPQLPPLHLPIAVAMPPPTIAAAPAPLAIALAGQPTGAGKLTVHNLGGPTLTFSQSTGGSAPQVWSNQPSANSSGYTSTKYTGLGAGDTNYFSADDFTITGKPAVDLAHIVAAGFTANHSLTSFGAGLALHWRIFGDAGGQPGGDPDTGGAVWSFDGSAGDSGVSVVGDAISLDLAATGLHTALAPGHYWLIVYPSLPCNGAGAGCTEAWYWLTSASGSGSAPMSIAPQAGLPWTPIDASTGRGFAVYLDSAASCAALPWLGVVPNSGSLGGGASLPLTLTATAAEFTGSSVTGYLCLQSNDAVTPLLPVQVNVSR